MRVTLPHGNTVPRVYVPPLVTGRPGACGCGCALTRSTSLGFRAVDFAVKMLGIQLYPWQRWLLIHAMELLPDGNFRFRTIIILVARQNGKTTLIEVKNLWKMLVLEVPLILGAAQNLDIAEESWNKAVEICEELEELAAEIKAVDKTNGKKQLRLVNGSRWKIIAATAGAGRGLAADDINLDELREHKNWSAWSAIGKTTMARPNAQTFGFSNAGSDTSVVLNTLQSAGRAAAQQAEFGTPADDSIMLAEWSVPQNVRCDCGRKDPDPDDPEDIPDPHDHACMLNDPDLWCMANPALGYGSLTTRAIKSALNTDPTATFLTEVLCQRVPTLAPQWVVISEKQHDALIDRKAIKDGLRPLDVAFCVQVSQDLKRTAIVAVGERPGHPEQLLAAVVEWRDGTAWAPARCVELREKWDPICFVVQDKGPTGALEAAIKEAGITLPENKEEPKRGDLINPWASDVADAYGQYVAHVRDKTLWHLDDPAVRTALARGRTRSLSGATAWDGSVDPPLIGITLAAWGRGVRLPQVTTLYDPIQNIG